jgi:RNA polymerase sigma-70 factor (ECF subfamily)
MELVAPRSITAGDLEARLLAIQPALIRRLALVVGDAAEAEDLAQSSVLTAWQNRHRFHGGDERAWLYTIALRLAFNELRRRRWFSRAQASAAPEQTWALSTDPDLWAALATLEPPARAALLLSALDGYTHAEIAAMLGVRPGTVSSWLSRTKEHLRAVLKET